MLQVGDKEVGCAPCPNPVDSEAESTAVGPRSDISAFDGTENNAFDESEGKDGNAQ